MKSQEWTTTLMSALTTIKANQRTCPDWINVPPVFIVGPPRSGTTLLRLMLTAHPNISISSEGAYIYRFRARFESYGELSQPASLETMLRDILPFLEAEKFLSYPGLEPLVEWVAQN